MHVIFPLKEYFSWTNVESVHLLKPAHPNFTFKAWKNKNNPNSISSLNTMHPHSAEQHALS